MMTLSTKKEGEALPPVHEVVIIHAQHYYLPFLFGAY